MAEFFIGIKDNKPFKLSSTSFLTHTAVMGASGSGKTVICKSIVEEAILQNIPVIAIDPKGDIASLGIGFDDFEKETIMTHAKVEAQDRGADPDDVANSARLEEECVFQQSNISPQAPDDSLIAEQIKQAIMENMQIKASPIHDLGIKKCFSVKAYSVEILTKEVNGTSKQSAIYVKTENGVMEVDKPSTDAELPELLKMIKPNFKLKT